MPLHGKHFTSRLLSLAGLIAGLAMSSAAIAQDSYKDMPAERWMDSHGIYLEARFGGPITSDYKVDMASPNVAGANGKLKIDTGVGFGGGVAVGKQFSRLWRGEVSWAYAASDDLKIDFSGAPANPFSPSKLKSFGKMSVHTIMVSAIRSWDFEPVSGVRPFSGAGLGVAIIDVSNVAPANSRFVIDDRDTVFAAALHSGVDIALSDRAVLTLRSDTILTTGATFAARDTTNAGGIMNVKSGTDLTWAISAGIRINLN